MSPTLLDALLQAAKAIDRRRDADDLVEAVFYGRATDNEAVLALSLARNELKDAADRFARLARECEETAVQLPPGKKAA